MLLFVRNHAHGGHAIRWYMFTDISVKLNYIKILKLNKMSFVSTAAN